MSREELLWRVNKVEKDILKLKNEHRERCPLNFRGGRYKYRILTDGDKFIVQTRENQKWKVVEFYDYEGGGGFSDFPSRKKAEKRIHQEFGNRVMIQPPLWILS